MGAAVKAGTGADPDDAIASVGIVEKRFFTLGGDEGAPFVLENRQILPRVEVAYEAYGTLRPEKDNVILVLHGITGSSHAAGKYAPSNRSTGYWDGLIGPGKVFDTDRFFVVAPNVLGGCRGSTGPSSIHPDTGRPYGLSFPIVTVRDMVRVQERFLRECFGIERLEIVTGGSMGGMQALEWAVQFSHRVRAAIPIATAARCGTRAIAFNECARRAILLDPRWQSGDYYGSAEGGPDAGLALARMIGTITYLSDALMQEKFGRKPADQESALEHDLHAQEDVRRYLQQEAERFLADFERPGFSVEAYLHDEGDKLVRRFDANSYLYLSKAMDLHDISRGFPSLADALGRITARLLLIAISSDDLFPARQTDEIVRTLRAMGRDIEHFVVESGYGHDAFLVEYRKMLPALRQFVSRLDRPGTSAAPHHDAAADARALAFQRLRSGR